MNTPLKLKSTERYGSSHTKGHGTTQFLHRGKKGRQKENSKEWHKFTRMQQLVGTQNVNTSSSHQKGIPGAQKNGKVWSAEHINVHKRWVKALKISQI